LGSGLEGGGVRYILQKIQAIGKKKVTWIHREKKRRKISLKKRFRLKPGHKKAPGGNSVSPRGKPPNRGETWWCEVPSEGDARPRLGVKERGERKSGRVHFKEKKNVIIRSNLNKKDSLRMKACDMGKKIELARKSCKRGRKKGAKKE